MMSPEFSKLARPFSGESFTRLRVGIYDDPQAEVYLNGAGDFAFLSPLEALDYSHYRPRVKSLGLEAYKKQTRTHALRHEKVASFMASAGSVLEVGAGDGGFMSYVQERHPGLDYACIEPDAETKPLRDRIPWLAQYDDFAAVGDRTFDVVCLFHVLEHIVEPEPFLNSCATLVGRGGRLVIEVPSLDDPLRSLFRLSSYEDFFFQKQHPYYYSPASLERLLRSLGYTVETLIAHQRYGIENHLNWLRNGSPGGNAEYREIFADADAPYRKSLEASSHSDAVIAIVRF
jgi:SAM-dependent methyltransferase